MRDRSAKWSLSVLGGLAVVGMMLWTGGRSGLGPRAGQAAQQPGGEASAVRADNPEALVLIYPTGDRATSSLLVETVAPAEVPVGKSYNYLIHVSNLTRNLILQDVEVNQISPDGFSIEDSRVLGREESGRSRQGQPGQVQNKDQARNKDGDQGQKDQNKDQAKDKDQGQGQEKNEVQNKDQAKNKNQGQGGQHGGQAGSKQQGGSQWMIDRLGPGESRTIRVTAVGDTEGMAATCIQVSYKPTLCVQTRFVKPEVVLTKSAPDRVDICEPLAFRYTLQNTGTGVARNLTIRDELPEGLTTADGKKVVELDVGDLAAGRSIDREVRVQANRPGDYAGRAVAQGADDLSARSRRTSTKVVQARLAATIEGPSVQYVGRPITYQVRVKNNGDAPAGDSRLRIDVDRNARVIRLSQAQPGDVDPSSKTSPTLAWDLGRIDPGQERTVSFTVAGSSQADLKHTVTATSACAAGGDIARMATVTESTTTSVLTFPALVLEMVDQNDPVPVGKEEVYTIAVRNQGSGPDEDVKIVVQLPEQLSFVSADGPTKAQADGRKVTFEPVDQLAPGERVVWKLRAKAEKSADVRTRVELSSAYLSAENPGISVEPTRLID